MDKRSVSSTTADDIDDGCVQQDTKALIAKEEPGNQNRKGGYHEWDKDGVHIFDGCQVYLNKSLEDRSKFIYKSKFCYGCLSSISKDHNVKNLPK